MIVNDLPLPSVKVRRPGDPEGPGEVGERFRWSATDLVHQHAVRGGCMRRRLLDPTHRAPASFEVVSAESAIGRPTATARKLVEASVSDNTRRAYAGAGALSQLDAWLNDRPLDDAALAAPAAGRHTHPQRSVR